MKTSTIIYSALGAAVVGGVAYYGYRYWKNTNVPAGAPQPKYAVGNTVQYGGIQETNSAGNFVSGINTALVIERDFRGIQSTTNPNGGWWYLLEYKENVSDVTAVQKYIPEDNIGAKVKLGAAAIQVIR